MKYHSKKLQNKRERILKRFDPNTNGIYHNGIFGLPFEVEESELVIIPVPWDVTTSYKDGAQDAPEAILKASHQIDLYQPDFKDTWQRGIAMDKLPVKWKESNEHLRKIKKRILKKINKHDQEKFDQDLFNDYKNINYTCLLLNEWVEQKANKYLEEDKLVAICGGDHSTPLGLLVALSKHYESFSILQIDAHMDLREKYEGFDYSHASAMFNVLKIPQVDKIVNVGLRDYGEEEAKRIKGNRTRIKVFTDEYMKKKSYAGMRWNALVKEIIQELSENVYISFDIDGLKPEYCPHTGTPVPGGLDFPEATYLIKELRRKQKKIIGFDLSEVVPSEDKNYDWDANVGMRILYELSCNALLTHPNPYTLTPIP